MTISVSFLKRERDTDDQKLAEDLQASLVKLMEEGYEIASVVPVENAGSTTGVVILAKKAG